MSSHENAGLSAATLLPGEELKPVIEYLARRIDAAGAALLGDAAASYAHVLGDIFEDIQRVDAQYLASNDPSPQLYETLRVEYREWIRTARLLHAHAAWPTDHAESAKKLDMQLDAAERVLRDYARADSGESRLRELLNPQVK